MKSRDPRKNSALQGVDKRDSRLIVAESLVRYGMEDLVDRIIINPDICNGEPVVKGTRITARTVIEFLAAGDSVEDVLKEYPMLTREDVLACLGFSARLLKHRFHVWKVA